MMPTYKKEDINILLVEDDQIDVRGITRTLRKNDLKNPMLVARDGLEALEILHHKHKKNKLEWPFIILLDINLPRMNGLEFLRHLRSEKKFANTVVFVLTTSDDERDIKAAYDQKVAGYIIKNYGGQDYQKLVEMLKAFIDTVRFPEEQSA